MLNAKALGALLSSNSDGRLCKGWFLMTPSGTLLAHSQPADMKDLRRLAATASSTWQMYSSLFSPLLLSKRTQETQDKKEQDHHNVDRDEDRSRADGQREDVTDGDDDDDDDTRSTRNDTRTLIIETDLSSTLLRYLQPQLILVLDGGAPPRKRPVGTRIWLAGGSGEDLFRVHLAGDETGADVNESGFSGRGNFDSSTSLNRLLASASLLSLASLNGDVTNGSGSIVSTSSRANSSKTVLGIQRAKLDAMADAIVDQFQQTGFQMPGGDRSIFF